MRNVEIKAFVRNPKDFLQRVESIARKNAVFRQVDYFFNIPDQNKGGRFKLRIQRDQGDEETAEGPGQLIYYERPDQAGPKLSNYVIYKTEDPVTLISTLEMALGLAGKVQKTRTLYMYGQTRIHYDEVNGLGRFMELEVVLYNNQTLEEGQEIANDLMKQLGIGQGDLAEGAYFDLLRKVEEYQKENSGNQ